MRRRLSLSRSSPLLLTLCVTACSRTPSPPTDPTKREEYWRKLDAEYEELTQGYDAKTGADQIRVEELRERMSAGEKIILLDVREAREHAVSALPGARHVPPSAVETATIDLPAHATVVTYCTAGYRSGVAAVQLSERLGRQVLNLHGGIVSWYNSGGEVQDPEGNLTDAIDAYGPDWQKFVHPRD